MTTIMVTRSPNAVPMPIPVKMPASSAQLCRTRAALEAFSAMASVALMQSGLMAVPL
jgi:hypothetical protein